MLVARRYEWTNLISSSKNMNEQFAVSNQKKEWNKTENGWKRYEWRITKLMTTWTFILLKFNAQQGNQKSPSPVVCVYVLFCFRSPSLKPPVFVSFSHLIFYSEKLALFGAEKITHGRYDKNCMHRKLGGWKFARKLWRRLCRKNMEK